MFSQSWFWISIFAFFFNANFYYYRTKGILNGTKTWMMESLSAISMLGVSIFWIMGLFFADHWWQSLLAAAIGIFCSGLLGFIFDTILPRGFAVFVGAISPIIAIALTIISYIVWF